MATRSDDKIVDETLQCFRNIQLNRFTFAEQWEEIASLLWPEMRNTFQYGSYNSPGQKQTQRQVDATGMVALSRFSAICDSLLTPRNMTWHQLIPSDMALLKDREVRLWFEDTTRRVFHWRYAPTSNFSGQNHNNYMQLGAFGTNCMFITGYEDPATHKPAHGLRYRSVPLGELYLFEDHQGCVTEVIRHFKLTAQQALYQFGEDKFPEEFRSSLEQNSQMQFDFLHRVCPRADYDPDKIDKYGKPWASYYVAMQPKKLVGHGGFNTFPYAIGRYTQAPFESYGRSPAMMVLPALKTLNDQKAVFLKTGHRTADPVLFIGDDGLVDNMDLTPGAGNPGGVTADGKLLIGTLPVGRLDLTKEMMDMEAGVINDVFLVSLFQLMTEAPGMTATEVIERVNEKGILLAPTVGRQQSEYLGPMIDRELDLLAQQGLLLPMPPALVEARGDYRTVYTSPLSLAMRAQEGAGFARTLETANAIVQSTGDPSYLDAFEFNEAIRGTAEIQGVPPSWMASDASIAQKEKNRAAQMQRQQQIQAAPAQAAIMSARAKQMKAQADAYVQQRGM